MSRKLATIRSVSKTIPIEGADFIELAYIDGWQCIVKKGQLRGGDKCVFFEIDSMIPLEEKYSFLGKATVDNTGTGYRIRTMKMRKTLSQGLALPLGYFHNDFDKLSLGADVTKLLKVWLYEPLHKQGGVRSHTTQISMWPKFIHKTDQERIQNLMHYFTAYREDGWEATLKLDGSSITMWSYDKAPHMRRGKSGNKWINKWYRLQDWWYKLTHKPDTFGVCSRNINLKEEEGNAFWDVANKYDMRNRLKGFNVAIQAELVGPKIQNNHENVTHNDFYIFDVFDIDKQKYMHPAQRKNFLASIGLLHKHVPILDTRFVFLEDAPDFDALQEYVTRPGMNNGVKAEGVVFKSIANQERSFKCISNNYLLKNKGS